MFRKLKYILLSILPVGSLCAQVKCELFKLIHHDQERRVIYFDNGVVRVSLSGDDALKWDFLDTTVHFNPKTKEFRIRPDGATPYAVKINGKELLLIDANDTVFVNKGFDSSTIKRASEKYNAAWKEGKGSFVNITYDEGRVDFIEIRELKRTITLYFRYSDEGEPFFKWTRIKWPETGIYMVIQSNIEGDHPYYFHYNDPIKKGGIATMFDARKNYITGIRLFSAEMGTSKNDDKGILIKYDKNGVIVQKSLKDLGCE